MREFKNKKARGLFLSSLQLDEIADKRIEEEMKNNGVVYETTFEIKTEAAGLRVLADDIEDGLIDEDEIEL